MNKKLLFLLGLLATLVLITACGADSTADATAEADEHDDEHMDDTGAMHIHVDPPEEFASLTNPEADHEEALAAGKELFTTNCVTCHGPEGKGDGEGAANLDPKPANLADGAMMGDLSDGYLFWRISKGGAFEPFNSAMPSWEQAFTEEQRWQLVTFVRSLSDDDHDDDEHAEDDHHEEEEMEQMEGDEHEESTNQDQHNE